MYDHQEEREFDIEEVSKIVKDSIQIVLGVNAYQHDGVDQWTSEVMERCFTQLVKLEKHFKYIVTCIITEKNGAGLQTASTCFWDTSTDGNCSVRWENESMLCNVNVYVLGI